MLSEDEPRLADGTTLNPHQVDALSGTLTALLADRLLRDYDVPTAPTTSRSTIAAPVLAVDDDEDERGRPTTTRSPPSSPRSTRSTRRTRTTTPSEAADETDPPDEDESPDGTDEDIDAARRSTTQRAQALLVRARDRRRQDGRRDGLRRGLPHRRRPDPHPPPQPRRPVQRRARDRGYADRVRRPLLGDDKGRADGPVTVETYQWFVRNAGQISSAYTIVICDEAHTALGEKTSAAIREWTGPIFIGMTATGALIARHVTDLFPTQTSRFDLAQAARRGVIAPLRCMRIPPGPGVRTIAKVPLRKGEVDVEFDQEMLAELLDQAPFNLAIADLYKTRFNGVPGVVYAAGVRHAYNVAEAFRALGIKAEGVSGETPKRELAEILARYERGEIDVLVNAQLLAEGWNSPRATVCMHLAPTASQAHLPAARRPRDASPPGQGGGRRRRLRPSRRPRTTTPS